MSWHQSRAWMLQGIGDGAGGSRLSARRCELAEVRLGPCSFKRVQALYHAASGSTTDSAGGSGSTGGGLELSRHTSGIVCGGLLGRCHLTFDYARMRLAVAPPL